MLQEVDDLILDFTDAAFTAFEVGGFYPSDELVTEVESFEEAIEIDRLDREQRDQQRTEDRMTLYGLLDLANIVNTEPEY